jgi:hypothetical protein
MKKTLLAAVAALAAACGGNDSKLDPSAVKFTYGAGTTPTTAQSTAASTGTTTLATAPSVNQSTTMDSTVADPSTTSIITLPEAMSSEVMGSSTTVMSAQTGAAGKAISVGIGKLTPAAAGFQDPACVTATTGAVTYSNCVVTMTDPTTGVAENVTVNGTVTRTVSGLVANVGWDLHTHLTATDSTTTLALGVHQTGAITITAPPVGTTDPWTLAGSARSDTDMTASAYGVNVSASVTVLAGYNDLQFVVNAGAVAMTGGSIELRRVWTARPPNVTEAQLPDEGFLFTWDGAGNLLVAVGTKQ